MGLPLSPIFANIFLNFHECNWLRDCPLEFKPLIYKRYVDDTFIKFRNYSHAPLFLDYLNSQHPNIKFTMEIENSGKLSFLDCIVLRSESSLEVGVSRKSTFTELGTSFFSYSPFIFKCNAIDTLLNRAYNICSNRILISTEFSFL